MNEILERAFYDRDPAIVARELLGKILLSSYEDRLLTARIVETEAYLSAGDEAAHGFKGRSARNGSLYLEAGHAYVHSMRQYCLLDIVTEGLDVPSAVLIRAAEPLEGIDVMIRRRRVDTLTSIASGPAKLCQAFAITRTLDGIDVTSRRSVLNVLSAAKLKDEDIAVSGRIGISKSKDHPLRFWIKGNPHVSR